MTFRSTDQGSNVRLLCTSREIAYGVAHVTLSRQSDRPSSAPCCPEAVRRSAAAGRTPGIGVACGHAGFGPASGPGLDPRDSGSRVALHARSRSEEHTSELQSLMRISYAVFCLKKKNKYTHIMITSY